MKKIIKEGIVPEATADCPICGCEFIYGRPEVEKVSDYEYQISCPCCEEKLKISYENKKLLKIF